ncbi:hypothetical protein MKX01_009519, partial [Papaver californicum]
MDITGENYEIGCHGKSSENPKLSVRLEFASIEEADIFYKQCERSNGFSICKRSSYATTQRGGISRVIFACVCEGVYGKDSHSDDSDGSDNEIVKRKKNTSTVRTDCYHA